MATVFNVQHFSIHDGPGIRTTVFFSGCPLRCLWCHNPESHASNPQIACFFTRCLGCGACVTACPVGALQLTDGRPALDASRCTACGACVRACPTGARRRYGEEYTPQALADLLLRDLPYYKKSGGGVTFSGGEPLLHTDFLLQLIPLLKERGVSVAMESCLYADYERQIEPLLRLVDLWMVDVKAMDDARHRAATARELQPILDNLRRISRAGASVLVRVPVVVGVNDDEQTAHALATYLTEQTSVRTVELLKLHKLAEHKYQALGRPYPAAHLAVPSEDCLRQIACVLQAHGLTVVRGEDESSTEHE